MIRYIDAEALIERLKFKRDTDTIDRKKYAGLECAIAQCQKAPNADVVEVRHGEWIDKPTGVYSRMQSWCSACGKHSGIGGIESNRHKPYCPNCGAKMDGERKENER